LSQRLKEEDVNVSDGMLIESLLLSDGNHLKRAAVLLFHENPERFFIGAYVKIGYFETGSDLLYQDEVHGPLITMADRIVDILYTKYFRGLISYDGLQRTETYPVPRAACREAVLNAVVHRDYSSGVPIQIKVFPDSVVIYNDGRLPENWTVDNLLTGHRSVPHNPNIANVFFRSGQIETWGRGIEKMNEVCKKEGRPIPIFEATASEIKVTFPVIPSYGNRVVEGVVEGVVEEGTGINDTQRAILDLMASNPTITSKDLSGEIGVSQRRIQNNIAKLKNAGFVERIGSDYRGRWIVKMPSDTGTMKRDGED
jgi:ATP-dependent DNA helicase RecG